MSYAETIARRFALAVREFERSAAIRLLERGEFTRAHYASLLRQIFHHARENPQLQALVTVAFRGAQREMVRPFLKHATSEIDHDKLALGDLVALGEDVSTLATERPLPATTALVSYSFHQVRELDPIGYLGYLYFLEHLPTKRGEAYAARLAAAGIPPAAMSFLQEHAAVDVGHNRLMDLYVEKLVRTPEDLSAVLYALDVTAHLYAAMFDAAVACADVRPVERFGTSPREARGPGAEAPVADAGAPAVTVQAGCSHADL